ncbi:MAG: hypothetical protein JSU66_17210 [Deltaproteobacteria bacterium]|nr:MAG: hypothetical protein JSU66_17210 [Deltaproteobacteria bacterium]
MNAAGSLHGSGERIQFGAVAADGVLGGLLAAAVVAVVFFIHDVIQGIPLHTPSVLGANLFWGAEAARSMRADVVVALAYNAVHMASLVAGAMLIAYVAALGQRFPGVWYLPFIAVATFVCGVLYVDGALGVAGLGRFRLTAVALLGASTVIAFLLWRHPIIVKHMHDAWRS